MVQTDQPIRSLMIIPFFWERDLVKDGTNKPEYDPNWKKWRPVAVSVLLYIWPNDADQTFAGPLNPPF